MGPKLLAISLLLAIGAHTAQAQEELVAKPTSNETAEEAEVTATAEEAKDGSFRSRKFINLTLGIEQDETLPPLPANLEFKGDFRRIVTALCQRP
jgi:pilus assembly protein CpaC